MKKIPYADLHSMPEDHRIALIGRVASGGHVAGVLLEKDEPEKIARYIRKLAARYPEVTLLAQVDGPTPGVVTLKFGKRPEHAAPAAP